MSNYLTSPRASKKMPKGIPYIIGNEAAERFSFYGMKGILVVFMNAGFGCVEASFYRVKNVRQHFGWKFCRLCNFIHSLLGYWMGNYVWDGNGIWALRVGSLRVMTDSSVIVLISGFMVLLPAFPWVFKPNAWLDNSKFF